MVAIYNPDPPTTPDAVDERVIVVRGDHWTQSVEVTEEDEVTPVDLSEWSDWTAQWRPGFDDTRVIQLDVVSGGADGILTVSATPEQTALMDEYEGGGWYDVQATSPQVRTFVIVRTWMQKDVTRA